MTYTDLRHFADSYGLLFMTLVFLSFVGWTSINWALLPVVAVPMVLLAFVAFSRRRTEGLGRT